MSFVPTPGNLGDAANNLACWRFLDSRFEEIEICPLGQQPKHRDVFVGGGGNFVEPLYRDTADFLLNLPLEHRPRLFPVTVFGHCEVFERWGPWLKLLCRDAVSMAFARSQVEHSQVRLSHDASFALDEWLERHLSLAPRVARQEVGRFFRRDREALRLPPSDSQDPTAAMNGTWLDMAEVESEVLLLAHRIARCREVVTDRLHGAILGALLGCEVTLHANAYFKNEAVHDHSLAAAGVFFVPGTQAADPALDPVRYLIEGRAESQRRGIAMEQLSA